MHTLPLSSCVHAALSLAAAIGLAWKMMRAALANLQPWWTAIVNSRAGAPDVPFGTSVPDVLAGGESVVSKLIARAQGLAPEYPRIFLWEDPFFDLGAASSQADSRSIRFRAGVAKGPSAPLHRLAATGLSNWALYEYPQLRFPPYPAVSAAGMKDAADHLASLASILAHELMHDLWRNELSYKNPWHTDRYPWCWGPRMDAAPPPTQPRALRPYRFEDSAAAENQADDEACRETPSAFLPTSGQPRLMDRATRHYAHYVMGAVVRGLLINNPGFTISRQDVQWCRDCAIYSALNGCGPATPVVQYPYGIPPLQQPAP